MDGEKGLKVGWVISNDRSWAASRLQGFLIHEWLQGQGISSTLLAERFNDIRSARSLAFWRTALRLLRSDCDVIVFEGGEWTMMQLAKLWRAVGKRAVGVRCVPFAGAYDDTYDLTIVPTVEIQRQLQIRRARVIDDCVQVPPGVHKTDYAASERLRVVWVGHQGYADYITGLVARLRQVPEIAAGFDFELISKGSFATRQWAEETVVPDILACDIALISMPQGEWFQAKSSNRLAMLMRLGMPTVATLIPAYEALARDGENGLFLSSDEQVAARLLALRDQALRERLGRQARQDIGDGYDLDTVARRWLGVLREAVAQQPPPLHLGPHWRLAARMLKLAR